MTALLLVSIFHFVSSTGYLIHYQNLHKICTICKFKKSLREMHKNMFVLKELVLFHLGPMRVLTHYWHKFPHSHTFCQTLSPTKLVPKMFKNGGIDKHWTKDCASFYLFSTVKRNFISCKTPVLQFQPN